MNICIIGSGWYGLHCAILLQNKYNITILEKESEIFSKSSFYNQNRLHLGFHYPRCYKTQQMCKTNFDLFIEAYGDVVEDISKNAYFISKKSLLTYNDYFDVFKNENMIIKNDNTILQNVYNKYFLVNEKIINNKKSKILLKEKINNCKLITNYTVKTIKKINNNLIINDDLLFDKVIDCTNNQLQISKFQYKFEKTISLIYLRKKKMPVDAITIMDGMFFSLYPIDSNCELYTLTHVHLTPFYVSNTFKYHITINNVQELIKKIEKDVLIYFPDFKDYFEYVEYFISDKTKLLNSINDSRECIIEENEDGILSVNCGKIVGIFEFEKYLKKVFK